MINSESGLEATFTFEGDPGDEIDESPFRVLVLGDWSGDAAHKELKARKPIEVDRDNFDDVLADLGTRLNLDQGDGVTLSLEFRSLDDFHPDQIFRQLPMFDRLRDLRKRLLSPEQFNGAAREVRSWFNVAESEAPAKTTSGQETEQTAEGSVLDAILSGKSGAAAPKVAASGEVASLIRDLVRPHLIAVDENEQSALLAAVDGATSDLMRRILHDPKFQSLEAAWRGLYLLVRRVETSTDLKIYILDVAKEELADDLRSVNSLSDSLFYKTTVRFPEFEEDVSWALVAANYGFLPDKDDVAALMRIAKISAVAGTPFVSHIRPEVLGVPSLFENSDPTLWHINDDSESSKLWSVLRSLPGAQYLGLTMPRFLARLPYGNETEPLETFQFEEFADGPDHARYLWSNSAFLAALLLAQTFSAYGWNMNLRFAQDVEGLPLHMYTSGGEKVFQPCSEALLTQNACEQLMEHGVMPLISFKNTDRVRLARFQSISAPVKGLQGRWY